MDFFDIHEQSPYEITISQPENMEDLSDLFVTREELEILTGNSYFHMGNTGQQHTFTLKGKITTEVAKWAGELEASGKKTLRIQDEELVAALKKDYLPNFTPETDKYGRHGDRICFARRYKRIKKKATQRDVSNMWNHVLQCAFRAKYDCYPPYVPVYNRSVTLFKAFKKIVGWRRCRQSMSKETVKFYRQVWDNPEEYIR